jgi:alpha-mannosidase
VAARITDEAGQVHEDVVTIDLGPETEAEPGGDGRSSEPIVGSASLARSLERALRTAGIGPGPDTLIDEAGDRKTGGELDVELLTREVRLTAGQPGELRVSVRNQAASEIRGEAQLISPHETWSVIRPWTQGFAVGPGEEATLTFVVDPPYDFAGGTYWALVKVMYFGRLHYTESVSVELVGARSAVPEPVTA